MTDDKLHILSDDEVEMYLKGDRREIDRLILLSLNRISRTLIAHSSREEKVTAKLDEMGGMEAISERAAYVDTLIERQKKRNDALGKIAQSTVVWALIVMLGFLSMAVWETVVHAIKANAGN